MRSEQKVSTESAQSFATAKKMLFFETSAKTAEHVNDCFTSLTFNIVQDLEKNQVKKKIDSQPVRNNIDLGKGNIQGGKRQGYCC